MTCVHKTQTLQIYEAHIETIERKSSSTAIVGNFNMKLSVKVRAPRQKISKKVRA